MEIKRFETNERMSKVVLHNNTLYLCGQTHDEGDVKEQTAAILSKIENLLIANNYSNQETLINAQSFVQADFKDMNSVWDAWVEKGFAPARACVEAKMAREALLVEISIVAAVK